MKKNFIIIALLISVNCHVLSSIDLVQHLTDLKRMLKSLQSNLIPQQQLQEEQNTKGSLLTSFELYSKQSKIPKVPEARVGARPAWYNATKDGYYVYQEETGIVAKRKIIVFAYGSLVNQKKNATTGNKLKVGTFIKTLIKAPVSFTRISGKGTDTRRATLVIDNTSNEKKNLWAAFSKFSFLPNARNNLAAREGAPFKENRGYDLSNIFYIKKLLPDQHKDVNEKDVPGVPGWVVLTGALDNRQELPQSTLKEMIYLAENNGATAAIWASFPSNATKEEIQKTLKKDPLFKLNTDLYVNSLPESN